MSQKNHSVGTCRVALCFALIVLLPPTGAAAQEKAKADDIGFVLDMSGDWELDSHPPQKIPLGFRLPKQSTLRPPAAAQVRSSYITIVLNDRRLVTYACDKPQTCEQPIRLKNDSSMVDQIVAVVKNLFAHEPPAYRPVLSRSGPALRETVVLLKNGRVDLSPSFRNLEKSSYSLQLQSLARDDRSLPESTPAPVAFDWNPAQPVSVSIPGLRPGLYNLSLSDPDNTQAWVLICGPESYPTASAAFQKAVDLTEPWRSKARPDAVRSFLRAYLEHLASRGIR